MKRALVCGAGGFIGCHLVRRLKARDSGCAASTSSLPEFAPTEADDFVHRRPARSAPSAARSSTGAFDEVYQLAADMGGAGYIFTGEHDADVMHNSATHQPQRGRRCAPTDAAADASSTRRRPACTPSTTSSIPTTRSAARTRAYPAAPDSEYGWEKLFSERLYLAYQRNHGLEVRDRALPQHLRARGHLARRSREGAGRDLPQGRRGARRRRDRDLGRRRADPLVPLHRRVPRRRATADALRLRRAGQHRLGRDGLDQRAGARW